MIPDGYSDLGPGKVAAVVTSLEMFARPPLRDDRGGLGLSLRHVTTPALDWYRDLFRRVGQDWLWVSRLRMSDAALAGVIHDPVVEVHALRVAGHDEGLLELDFRQRDVCELGFFGLTAACVGTGAGRWLMNRALETVWSRPIKRFWVHTCTLDHPHALPFYVRSGFHPFRRQVEVFDDPRTSGALPRSAAPHLPIIASDTAPR